MVRSIVVKESADLLLENDIRTSCRVTNLFTIQLLFGEEDRIIIELNVAGPVLVAVRNLERGKVYQFPDALSKTN